MTCPATVTFTDAAEPTTWRCVEPEGHEKDGTPHGNGWMHWTTGAAR